MVFDFSHVNLPSPSSPRPGFSPICEFLQLFLLHLVVVIEEEQLLFLLGQLSRGGFQFLELRFFDENVELIGKLRFPVTIPCPKVLGVGLIIIIIC